MPQYTRVEQCPQQRLLNLAKLSPSIEGSLESSAKLDWLGARGMTSSSLPYSSRCNLHTRPCGAMSICILTMCRAIMPYGSSTRSGSAPTLASLKSEFKFSILYMPRLGRHRFFTVEPTHMRLGTQLLEYTDSQACQRYQGATIVWSNGEL